MYIKKFFNQDNKKSLFFSDNPFVCYKDGLFADPKAYNKFYRCNNLIAHHFNCSNGLKFNIKKLVCDYPDQIDYEKKKIF